MPINMLKTVWKSDNKYLRHSNIGSKVINMLINSLQNIACYVAVPQELWGVLSWIYSIASCDRALKGTNTQHGGHMGPKFSN